MGLIIRRQGHFVHEHWTDLLALAGLVIVGLALFWPHILGIGTFFGDSDRLDTYLNVRKFEVASIQRFGHVPAWNSLMFMGYGMYGLHYMLASADPLAYLEALFPLPDLFRISGYVSAALVILAGWSAYWYIKDVCRHTLAAWAGAVLYVCSTFAIIRIVQVDWDFYSLIAIPLGLLILRRTQEGRIGRCFVGMAAVTVSLFVWGFLQGVAYLVILFTAYAAYRSAIYRNWRAISVLVGSGVVAGVSAIPRLLTVLQDTTLLDRSNSFQTTCPCELLRWLYDGIFGRYTTEAAALGNGINLHEGFQVYTSTFAALLVLLGVLRFRRRLHGIAALLLLACIAVTIWLLMGRPAAAKFTIIAGTGVVALNWAGSQIRGTLKLDAPRSDSERDVPFYTLFIAFVLAVVLIEPVRRLFYLAFFKLDFTHSRISVTAVLPLCTLAALYLRDWFPRSCAGMRKLRVGGAVGIAAALAAAIVWSIDGVAQGPGPAFFGLGNKVPLPPWISLSPSGVIEIGLSLLWFMILALAAWLAREAQLVKKPDILTIMAISGEQSAAVKRQIPAYCLLFATVFQAFAYTNLQLNGAQNWTFPRPFYEQDFFYAPANALRPPSEQASHAFATRLDTQHYRTELLSDPDNFGLRARMAEGGHEADLSHFWNLRVVGGYVPGVDKRLAELPWPEGVRTLRSISFRTEAYVPWPLLAVLNVKYLLTVSPEFYYNLAADGSEAKPSDVQIQENPLPVTPRQFFAASVRPRSQAAASTRAQPDAPAGLNATALPAAGIRLTWEGSKPGLAYRIEQAEGDSRPFRQVITTSPNATSADVNGLQFDTQYTFRVTACRGNSCSNDSREVTAMTSTVDVLAPVDLKAEAVFREQVNLAWSDATPPPAAGSLTPSELAEKLQVGVDVIRQAMARTGKAPNQLTLADFGEELTYRIEAQAGSTAAFEQVGVAGPGVRTYTATGLQPLTTYRFRVRACLNGLCSPDSKEVNAATPSDLTTASLKGIVPPDPTRESWVDGISGETQYATDGSIQAQYDDDRIDIAVAPSATPRFLVLNEMYHPAWHAYAGGIELKVYPTNVVMRGIVVPPGVDHIRFEFVPFLATAKAKAIMAAGLLVAAAAWWLLKRLDPKI